jgi:hypothetical protein
VGAFVGKLEPFDRLRRRVMHEVKLRTGLIRVGRWKLAEEPMQPEEWSALLLNRSQYGVEQPESPGRLRSRGSLWSSAFGLRSLVRWTRVARPATLASLRSAHRRRGSRSRPPLSVPPMSAGEVSYTGGTERGRSLDPSRTTQARERREVDRREASMASGERERDATAGSVPEWRAGNEVTREPSEP